MNYAIKTIEGINEKDIPPFAYHPSHEKFEQPPLDQTEADAVSGVEQLLRVAIAIDGEHSRDLAKKAIECQREHEEKNIYPLIERNRQRINESNDVWLQNQINPLIEQQEKIIRRRNDWYDDDVLTRLNDKIQRAIDMLHGNGDTVTFDTATIINTSDHNLPNDTTIHTDELSDEIAPLSEFGFELPINTVICTSPSGNKYPFVPWFGTTVCTGPSKHQKGVTTLCKHEVAALIKFSQDEFEPEGVDIPQRFNRLVAPQAYARFRENIDV